MNEIKIEGGRPFLAMCPNYWGTGWTIPEAVEQMLEAGGTTSGPYIVWQLPAGASEPFVDDFGTVRWRWDDDVSDEGRDAGLTQIEAHNLSAD